MRTAWVCLFIGENMNTLIDFANINSLWQWHCDYELEHANVILQVDNELGKENFPQITVTEVRFKSKTKLS